MSEPTKPEIRDQLITDQKSIIRDLDTIHNRAMTNSFNDFSGAVQALEAKSQILIDIYDLEINI